MSTSTKRSEAVKTVENKLTLLVLGDFLIPGACPIRSGVPYCSPYTPSMNLTLFNENRNCYRNGDFLGRSCLLQHARLSFCTIRSQKRLLKDLFLLFAFWLLRHPNELKSRGPPGSLSGCKPLLPTWAASLGCWTCCMASWRLTERPAALDVHLLSSRCGILLATVLMVCV